MSRTGQAGTVAAGTDSAGRPWAGRHFDHNAFVADDGTAPGPLMEAIRRFQGGEAGVASAIEVVEAFRHSRLLVPLVARREESGVGPHGITLDKSAELSIVTVAGPDGRNVLPVFGSVESMGRWDPQARPVPVPGVRVALAAASEQTDLVVLDPGSASEYVIRRPALWAIAQSRPWTPSFYDPDVLAEFVAAAEPEPSVTRVHLAPGDPQARLAGPELIVTLQLNGGLDRVGLDGVLSRLQERWSSSEIIAARVDSLAVRLTG